MPCSKCNIILSTGLHCTVCNNFKLCMPCFEKEGHSHEMKALTLLPSGGTLPRHQSQINPAEVEELPLKRYVRILFRAYRSQEGNYGATAESLYAHVTSTKLICNCIFCKQMFLIYTYHLKKCRTPKCRVSRCPVINERLLKKRLAATSAHAIEKRLLRGQLTEPIEQAAVSSVSNLANPLLGNVMLARKFTIQRCIRTLVHACQCVEQDCMPVSCHKMKRILAHVKICQRKIKGGCTICKQLCTLCTYHAKTCTETKCPVLLCSAIKRKIQQAYNKKRCVAA